MTPDFITLQAGNLAVTARWVSGWTQLSARTADVLAARADLLGIVQSLLGFVGRVGVDSVLPRTAPQTPFEYKFGGIVEARIDTETVYVAFKIPYEEFVKKLLPLKRG